MRPSLALAAALVLASPAHAFRASNGMSVDPTGPDEVTVAFRSGRPATAYWCAAGDYFDRAENLARSTRLYRVSPPPRKQGQGITFSTDASKAAAKSGLTVFGSPDGTISIGHATSAFCNAEDVIPFGSDR